MVVGLDVFPLRTFTTGTEEYVEGLAGALLRRGVNLAPLGGAGPLADAANLGLPPRARPSPWEKWQWERRGVLQAARARSLDVVHIPYLAHPPRRFPCPSVVTVHDVIPYQYPGYARRLRDRLYFRALPGRLRHATRLVAVSEATRAAAVALFPEWAPRLTVIPNGIHDAYFAPPDPEARTAVRRLLGAIPPDIPIVLYVGNYQPHKNVPLLLRAFAALVRRRPARLVLVGAAGNASVAEWLARAEYADAVLRLPALDRPLLRALYAEATVFAFPSVLEGFGLPPVQALACGVPTIVGRALSVREAVGDAALVVENDQPEAWADALMRLAAPDSKDAARLREAGPARAERYRWNIVAAAYQALYEELSR